MAKNDILKELKSQGFKITNQREVLIETILENECSTSKEIYYYAAKKQPGIGIATVYRMINTLEEMGILEKRKLLVKA